MKTPDKENIKEAVKGIDKAIAVLYDELRHDGSALRTVDEVSDLIWELKHKISSLTREGGC